MSQSDQDQIQPPGTEAEMTPRRAWSDLDAVDPLHHAPREGEKLRRGYTPGPPRSA
jgi:hypothetical protein